VVLVAVKVHLVLLCPAGITVFLAELVGLLFPGFGSFALLDLPVFLTAVALTGNFNEAGVDDLAGVGEKLLLVKGFVESVEQRFDDAFLDEGFAELPDGLRIRNLVARFQAEKAPEAQPVCDLILHLVV